MATGAAATAPLGPLSLTVKLILGQPAQEAAAKDVALPAAAVEQLGRERAGDDLYATILALPGAAALLHPAALSTVAKRLLALAGALSPGADVGVLGRAMQELERLAGGGTAVDRADLSTSTSDMDIDSAGGGDAFSSSQMGGGTGAARGRSNPGTKRKREARRTGGGGGGDDAPGMSQRPAKRRILAWRVRRWYRSLVAKAKETARRARSRRARAQPLRRKRADGWKSVEQQLARATLSDGLHRWSPGGAGGGPAGQ